jgi:uncharacterized protein with GYD domain
LVALQEGLKLGPSALRKNGPLGLGRSGLSIRPAPYYPGPSAFGVGPQERFTMATFIVLGTFTDQGIRNIKDTTKRADAFRELAKSLGATVKDVYWTLGQYDVAALVEAPDDAAVTALGLTLAKAGNVRTQTLRAFSRTDMDAILGKVA